MTKGIFRPWPRTRLFGFAGLVLGVVWMASAQPAATLGTNLPPEEAGFTLKFVNRPICTFRATLNSYSPEERAAAASVRLKAVLSQASTMLVTTQAVPSGIQISLDSKPLFVLTLGDVSSLQGESLETKAANVAAALQSALQEARRFSTPRQVWFAVAEALFGLVLFAGLVWATRRLKRWLLAISTHFVTQRTEKLASPGLRAASSRTVVAILRAVLNFATYLFIAFLAYALIWYELRVFPYSKPLGDYLRSRCLTALASFGREALSALPDLAVVVIIFLAARLLVHLLTNIFAAVKRGEIQAPRLDLATATTTRRLLILVIWVVAVVVSYPYIPGSQSLAFKGVTVFIGLIISLGSTNIVNQIASGLILIYTRSFRTGDYVRVEEHEGTVLGVGLCVTSIRTAVQNEEVRIANSVLLGVATKNYSQLAQTEGLLLPAKVTIGYSTPWRQVHAMLLEAARRTRGLAAEPPPFVLQLSLSDFYVEYQVNARLERPERRLWVLSDLQAHIQDVFNEYGVQIMSPHYWRDPPKPHVVPPSNWFIAPAQHEGSDGTPEPGPSASR